MDNTLLVYIVSLPLHWSTSSIIFPGLCHHYHQCWGWWIHPIPTINLYGIPHPYIIPSREIWIILFTASISGVADITFQLHWVGNFVWLVLCDIKNIWKITSIICHPWISTQNCVIGYGIFHHDHFHIEFNKPSYFSLWLTHFITYIVPGYWVQGWHQPEYLFELLVFYQLAPFY